MNKFVDLIRTRRSDMADTNTYTIVRFVSLLAVCMLVCISQPVFGAGGDLEWPFTQAVPGKQESRAIVVDSSGNTIMTGYTQAGSSDYYTIKVLADGSGLAWPAKTFDLAGAQDLATAVAVDGNDDIIVTGYAYNGGSFDILTIKYSGVDGSIIWQHIFDGTGGGDDFASAVAIDSYDNIYVGGTMQNASAKDDFVIIKYVPSGPNPDGTPTWSVAYDGPANGHDRLTAIAVGIDGIAVTGESQNAATDFDFVIVKFDLNHVKRWEKRYDDLGDGKGLDIAIDKSGAVIATGYVDNGTLAVSNRDHYTVKYPSIDGPAVWSKTRDRDVDDQGRVLWLDDADNVYVAGSSFTPTTAEDLTVTRYAAADGSDTAPDGWHVDYNTANGNSDVGIGIVGSNSGDVFVTSVTNDSVGGFNDIYIYKFSKENGNLLWPAMYGSTTYNDFPVGLGLAPDGHPIVAGWSDTAANSYDFIAIKYNAGALDAPTSLTAATGSISEISLNWVDNSDNEDNFVIERKNGTSNWTEIISSLLPGTTSYNDTGLTQDHRYYYRVKAINSTDGSSAWSNEADARTTIIDYDPPIWQHTFAGSDGGDDEPAAIAVGPDNHPAVTGFSFALEGGYDYYTVKLDRADAGVEQWSARYNDGDNEADYATAVTIDSSNRVVVSGYSSLFFIGGDENTNDIYTLSYPSAGSTPIWTHQYNGPAGNDDRSSAVASAVDGSDNIVVVGYGKNASAIPDNDIYVVKYSADGAPIKEPLWAATPFDGGGEDQPADVAYDQNGDIFVVGKTWRGGNFDYFVAKYNGIDGSMAWGSAPRYFNGAGNSTDYATSLAVDAFGDLYVTGYSVGSAGHGDIVTIKYAGATGDIVSGWPKIYDGGGYDSGVSIGVDPINNDIVVAGTTFIGPGNKDVIVVRYGSDGSDVWTKFLDFTGGDEGAAAMSIDRTGVACVAAATDSGSGDDIVAVMFDHNGLIVGANVLAGAAGELDYPVDVVFNNYGEAFVAGVTTNADNNTDFIVFKTTSTVVQSPSPLTATQLYTEANLFWSDNSLDETGFNLEFKTGTCSDVGVWQSLPAQAADTTEYLASGLDTDATYCFRVQSHNALGEKSRWAEVDVQTSVAEAPGNLVATPLNSSEILLEWDDLTVGESVFNLQRCIGAGCDFSSFINIELPPEQTSYVDFDVCEGMIYRYQINAEKQDVWVSPYSPTTPDVSPVNLPAPSMLSTDWVSEEWVELKWKDNSSDETAFIVERCVGASCADIDTIPSLPGNLLHLRMDESSWNNTPSEVTDLSTTGSHGQAYGSAITTSDGKYANAGLFNGTTAYVSTPLTIDQSAATSQGATFAAWVYPASVSANYHFVVSTDDGGNDWSLMRRYGTWYVANGTNFLNTGIAATANAWQHLALVFNPVSGLTFYKSDESGTSIWNNATIGFDDSSAVLHIGRRGSLNQEFFDGRIDEVTVFDRPLAAAEVGVLFEHGVGRYNDRTVAHSTIYNYRVKAYKDAFCDATSLPATSIQLTTNPPVPTNLLATVVDSGQIALRWNDNTTSETGFRIDRCQGSGCSDFTELATVTSDVTFYADRAVCADPDLDSVYNYQVTAIKDVEWSSLPSASSQAVILKVGTPPTLSVSSRSEETLNLELTYGSSDLSGFHLSRCDGDVAFCSDSGNFAAPDDLVVTPSGNQLLMHMDEPSWNGSANDVADSSGSGNYGTSHGGVTTVAGGKYGRGGWFNGTDDYISTPLIIDQSSDASPGATFEAWVYPTANNSYYKFVIGTDNGGYDWGVNQRNSTWHIMNGAAHVDTGMPVTLNAWQHIVVVFEPKVGVKFYKNGSGGLVTSVISYDANAAGNDFVTIGRIGTSTSSSYHFVGGIDEVAIYNRVLSAAEVLTRYQRPLHFVDSGLPTNIPYSYKVTAYKNHPAPGCDWESNSSVVLDTTTLAPPAPTNLNLAVISSTQVNLSWTDNATSETGYRIQWCEGVGCSFPVSPEENYYVLGADAQGKIDETVCENNDYSYRVRAEKDWVSEVDNTWVTDWTVGYVSTIAKAATDNFAAVELSESEISLTWADNNVDEDAYILQKCINNDAASCQVSDDVAFTAVAKSIESKLWLKMDEASWGTALNSAAGGNDAVKLGDATPVNDAERGQVGQFDGSGDHLRVNHYAGINPTNSITVAVWAKSSGPTWDSDHSLLSKRNAYILSPVLGTGQMRFYIYSNGAWRVVQVNPGVDIAQWHHYVGVYDGTNLILYVDGVARGSAAWSGSINADTSYLYIGRDDNSTADNRNFGGWMDDVIIFDSALAPATILSLYNEEFNLSADYLDTGLTPSTEYFYRLRAHKEATCSWPTEWDLQSATTISPPAPTDLKLTATSTTQVDLSWVDNSGSETGYRVQWCEGVSCVFAAVPSGTDSILLPADTLAYSHDMAENGETYSYRVRAVKGIAPGWPTAWLGPDSVTTLGKFLPANLTANRISEAQVELSWEDSNGDETSFKIERCVGDLCVPVDEIDTIAGNGAETTNLVASGTLATGTFTPYSSNVIHPTTGATVRALRLYNNGSPQASNSALMALKPDTNYIVTFEAWCDAGVDIPLQNDLLPDTLPEFQHIVSTVPKSFRVVFNSSHPDILGNRMMRFFHYNASRYIYVTNINVTPPTIVTYADVDSGLLPGTTYHYQVTANKTTSYGPNSWVAGPSNIASVTTDVLAPSGLAAVAINTTEVGLAWIDNADAETGTEIWRCEGLSCGGFAKIDEVGPNVTTYNDVDVAKETDYQYKVVAKNEGLSSDGGGTWSHYAPVVISPFISDAYYQITVPYDNDMQSSFDDLRFYDETAERQLPYWIKEFVSDVSATVWVKTRGNNTINMYYSNPDADDVGNREDFYDNYDFSGTVIDTDQWIEIDAYDAIEQNDGLLLHTTANYSWNKALISQKVYDRQFQWELYADLTINADTNAGSGDYFTLGWLLNQKTFTHYNHFVHGLYWSNYWLRTYEKGSNGYIGKAYAANTNYEMKVALTPIGSEYSIRGGEYADWTLLKTLDTYTDQYLRLAVGQRSHNVTIHSMTVNQVPLSATLGGEVVNVRTDFGYQWPGVESNIAPVQTLASVAPSNLIATAISDTAISLSWTDNTDDETGFKVERCLVSDCSSFTQIGLSSANEASYIDASGLLPATSYRYRVRSYKTAVHDWDSDYSNETDDLTYSAMATGLDATALNSQMIQLVWNDVAIDEDGYEIQVKVWNGRFVTTGVVGANETKYIDKVGIEEMTPYTYRVRPFRGTDKSPFSVEDTETTPAYVVGDNTCP